MGIVNYKSGLRLRKLREIKGLKEKELAEILEFSFEDIILWEESIIPNEKLSYILDFFEISNTLFETKITSDEMLSKLAINELNREELEKELAERLNSFNDHDEILDLSSLGLLDIPNEILKNKKIKKLNLNNNLLTNINDEIKKLINEGVEVTLINNFLDPTIPFIYNKKEINKNITIQKKTSILLKSLELKNIGIYNDLKIDINDQLTVLIGVNGSGKTTILKAMSLAILGPKDSVYHSAMNLRSIDIPKKLDSTILLTATINGIEFKNRIIIRHNDETSEFDIVGNEFKELYESDNILKNLILCLGEQRNNTIGKPKQHLDLKPRTLDLLPLLRGNDQSCLEDWSSWLANLENKKSISNEIEETINLCFKVFSKFMGESIKSAGLKKVEPESELWITYRTGRSIPLKLASQGYQSVMGWVGFIIQRMIESNEQYSFPLSQPSIIIIDEIDQLLSIKWQQKILPILMEFFPNTQWIISTHSPMVLTDLEKHQIIQLIEKDGSIIAETNEVDLWMWQYSDIIRKYFEITTKEPKYKEKEIKDEIIELLKKEKNNETILKIINLEGRLEKVKESIAAVDEFEKQLQSLKHKEKQLIEIMESLKKDC